MGRGRKKKEDLSHYDDMVLVNEDDEAPYRIKELCEEYSDTFEVSAYPIYDDGWKIKCDSCIGGLPRKWRGVKVI